MKLPMPGGRILKTVLAVFICLIIRVALGHSSIFYAVIAAVMCTGRSSGLTFLAGINRFIGTLIGAAVGYLVLRWSISLPFYSSWGHLFIIPAGLMLAMWLTVSLKKPNSVAICGVVFLSIVTNFDRTITDTGLYVFTRILDTGIGILVASLVSMLPIGSPEQEDKA